MNFAVSVEAALAILFIVVLGVSNDAPASLNRSSHIIIVENRRGRHDDPQANGVHFPPQRL
jgi:hypothetical protein